jgi:hypothetical protein
MDHPALVPTAYCLFSNFKKHIKGRKFSSTEEATSASDGVLVTQPREILLRGLEKLKHGSHKSM